MPDRCSTTRTNPPALRERDIDSLRSGIDGILHQLLATLAGRSITSPRGDLVHDARDTADFGHNR